MHILLKILGFLCLLLGIGPGIFLLTCGITLILTQLIFMTHDARGYAGAYGIIALIPGILLSTLLIPAVKLLKLKVKYLVIPALLVALFPIYFGVRNIIFEMKINEEYQNKKGK